MRSSPSSPSGKRQRRSAGWRNISWNGKTRSLMNEAQNMNLHKPLRTLTLVTTLSLLLWMSAACADPPAMPAAAKATFGAVVGIVRNPAKLAIAEAVVTAIRTDGGGVRAAVSGSDGVYSFADLPPGSWSLTFQADGYPEATAPAFTVTANQATRVDMVM